MALLPAESSLSNAAPSMTTTAMAATASSSSNSSNVNMVASLPLRNSAASPAHTEPAQQHQPPPPAYSQSPMPSLPPRKTNTASPASAFSQQHEKQQLPQKQPPPPVVAANVSPEKPVLCRARALYKYNAQDSRDCSFDKDDRIDVYEYMNADWWMGRNCRTGAEGIFPRNYVEQLLDEKSGGSPAAVQMSAYSAPPPPGQHNPYNNDVPPMAVANHHHGVSGEEGENKGKEMGKKFGKKLGNAAIFGAGATMGSNLVNSIF